MSDIKPNETMPPPPNQARARSTTKPLGIYIVAALTFLASGPYAFLGILSYGLWGVTAGPTGEPVGQPPNLYTFILPCLLLPFYALMLAILLFAFDFQSIWFGAIVFWILNIIFWTIYIPFIGIFGLESLIPFIYSVGCITYFMFPKIRKHFDISAR
jgi:hypothetical protein